MMKKYIFTAVVALTAFACNNNDTFESAFRQYVGINSVGLSKSIGEDDGSVTIPVKFGGDFKNASAITVAYTVSGGTYGTDYTIDGGSGASGTVTIPAGELADAKATIKIVPVADFITEEDVPLTVTITSVTGGDNLQIGYPLNPTFSVTIADDDCDYVFANLTGVAESMEIYADSEYGPYDTEFSEVSENRVSLDNFWDSGMEIEFIYHPDDRSVEVVDQTWSQYGFTWNIEGSGKMNTCGNSLKVTVHFTSPDYSGGYDDTFDLTYAFPEPE